MLVLCNETGSLASKCPEIEAEHRGLDLHIKTAKAIRTDETENEAIPRPCRPARVTTRVAYPYSIIIITGPILCVESYRSTRRKPTRHSNWRLNPLRTYPSLSLLRSTRNNVILCLPAPGPPPDPSTTSDSRSAQNA